MNLIFVDIDNTLLDDNENKIPESAKNVICSARSRGDLVFINTGRCRAQVYPYITDIGFDGIICSDGEYVEFKNKILKDNYADKELMKEILDFLTENKIEILCETSHGVFQTKGFTAQIRDISQQNLKIDFKEMFPNQEIVEKINPEGIGKINFVFKPEQEILFNQLYEKYSDKMTVSRWKMFDNITDMGSVGGKNADKVHGVELILQHLNLENVKTFAFGDADADVEMIKFCSVGVAMGNATEKLKAAADYVTSPVNKDGLAEAFNKFIL